MATKHTDPADGHAAPGAECASVYDSKLSLAVFSDNQRRVMPAEAKSIGQGCFYIGFSGDIGGHSPGRIPGQD